VHAMSDTVAAIVKLEQEYGGASTASLRQLFRYATPFDAVCMVLGFIGAGVVGGAQPCMMVLLGDLVDVMGLQAAGADMEKMFNDIAIKMIALGGICFVAAWVGRRGGLQGKRFAPECHVEEDVSVGDSAPGHRVV